MDARYKPVRAKAPGRCWSPWKRARIVLRPLGTRRASDQVVLGLRVLAGAVTCVLLIACANAASLLLVRGSARAREVAVRLALGAGQGRVVRQVLTESLFLSLVAGALALVLSVGGVAIFARAIPPAFTAQSLHQVAMDHRVVFYTFGVAVGTGLLFGVLPAVRTSRADPEVNRLAGLGSLLQRQHPRRTTPRGCRNDQTAFRPSGFD